jgi:hypothetical protein
MGDIRQKLGSWCGFIKTECMSLYMATENNYYGHNVNFFIDTINTGRIGQVWVTNLDVRRQPRPKLIRRPLPRFRCIPSVQCPG